MCARLVLSAVIVGVLVAAAGAQQARTAASAYADTVLADNPVSYWRLAYRKYRPQDFDEVVG
jgi:hypothetical protein